MSPKNKHLRSCGYFAIIYPVLFYNVGEVRYTWTNLLSAADLNIGELKM